MRVRHIIHPSIAPVEYYFCSWQSQNDINEFCKKCTWFDKSDAILGKRVVIEFNNEDGNNWYEIFEIQWFKQYLQDKLNIDNAIMNEFLNFYQRN